MGHSYDLWWADLSAFKPDYAKVRQAAGDTVWWYFLYGDLPPHFNPITIDHPGIESRIAFWAAWKYRIKGFAYYSVTGWGSRSVQQSASPRAPTRTATASCSIRPRTVSSSPASAGSCCARAPRTTSTSSSPNGGVAPQTPDEAGRAATRRSRAPSPRPTSFTRDASALQAPARRARLDARGQARNGCPALDSKLPGAHPRAAYYINFQDPAGEPTANPLVVERPHLDQDRLGRPTTRRRATAGRGRTSATRPS